HVAARGRGLPALRCERHDGRARPGRSDPHGRQRYALGYPRRDCGGSNDWLKMSAGGIAYVNSFSWDSDTPVFVFENQLGNGNEKYTAEAISHEVGHTLGLSHDGGPSAAYYQGHGSGETGWAPIMGVGYYRELTQWSRGEYSGATNPEDDLKVIVTKNGFGYRQDDHGNTAQTATDLGAVSSFSSWGIIERSSDVDVFTFTVGAGDLSLTI